MSRQLETEVEVKQAKRRARIGLALEIGLESAVSRAGGVLQGFSVRIKPEDCLLIMRVEMPAGPMVVFCGGSDAAGCIIKAFTQANRDELKFVPDRYAKNGGRPEETI